MIYQHRKLSWVLQAAIVSLFLIAQFPHAVCAQITRFPEYRFTNPQNIPKWIAAHDLAPIRQSGANIELSITGADPYAIGPEANYPTGTPLWLEMRLLSQQGGTGQVFYFRDGHGPVEQDSAKFPAPAGKWCTIRVPIPALGAGFRLRFDPPGEHGTCLVSYIRTSRRVLLPEPVWQGLRSSFILPLPRQIISGSSTLSVSTTLPDQFVMRVSGKVAFRGIEGGKIGFTLPNTSQLKWLDLRRSKIFVKKVGPVIRVTQRVVDGGGATWLLDRTYKPLPDGGFQISSQVQTNHKRRVVYLPVLLCSSGEGGPHGEEKEHGLFAGLEYLDKNEPSSSEQDLIGPQAIRSVTDTLRITMPLMVVEQAGLSSSFSWKFDNALSAVFDSPDRIYHSHGHVMGLLFPGSNGTSDRVEGNLLPYEGTDMLPGHALFAVAELHAQPANSVLSAVQQYLKRHPLPVVPMQGVRYPDYILQAAHAWLDSAVSANGLYRHAFVPGGNFNPGPAADAALLIDWLASVPNVDADRGRLILAARNAISKVPLAERAANGVSHVRYPAPCLNFGGVADSMNSAKQQATGLATMFEPDGRVLYRASPDKTDLGKTHFEKDANGLTSQLVFSLLQNAAFAGDWALINHGIALLHRLDRFENTVPRGAQTWEVPLHTPDILASANMVNAYVLGYRLTGDKTLLKHAEHWAWSGVPFVYLRNPTAGAIGLYATTPVLGATQWISPNWMGLPVQWCGLVFSAALYELADVGSPEAAFWARLADGITASGIQQSYPATDPNLFGLLPDSFSLRPQTRNFAAINPGTLQVNAIRLFRMNPVYQMLLLPGKHGIVHAPCHLRITSRTARSIELLVEPWQSHPVSVLISGIQGNVNTTITEKNYAPSSIATERDGSETGRMILQIHGSAKLVISWDGP